MKRRDFIAATALLSLFGGDAWAARKKTAAKKKAGRNASRNVPKNSRTAQPVAHTPDAPVTDRPPLGSSASRLPPVKAPEPPTEWMNYEVTTVIQLPKTSKLTRLWLPLPLNQDTLFQRTISHNWRGNADFAGMRRLPDGDLETYYAEWKADSEPQLRLTTTVSTADRHFDVTKRTVAPERDDILRRHLQASTLIPNDGPAHQLGERIVGRIKDPVAQAKAIYDWVVDNTTYNPDIQPGGTGNVRKQFDTAQYGGRSADINGLFVALCRAIGIPARCVYGLRVGNSRLLKSLGLSGENLSRGQHCRAEFYIPGYGWIPVDPSDVRRAIAFEGLTDRDSKLSALKKVLFGVWEMNWIAYNLGADLTLPGAQTRIPFFATPRLEIGEGSNSEAVAFDYLIQSRRVEI